MAFQEPPLTCNVRAIVGPRSCFFNWPNQRAPTLPPVWDDLLSMSHCTSVFQQSTLSPSVLTVRITFHPDFSAEGGATQRTVSGDTTYRGRMGAFLVPILEFSATGRDLSQEQGPVGSSSCQVRAVWDLASRRC